MSKAEEYSFNIPSELFQQLTKEQQVLWRKEIENTFNNGYHQAEKDLELDREDIKIILDIEIDILRECNSQKELVIETYPKGEDYYGEILKRLKDFKERKERKG
jgi:hypothetical protein